MADVDIVLRGSNRNPTLLQIMRQKAASHIIRHCLGMAVSERQAYRLLAKYELDGRSGLIHKARGRISNRSTNEGVRKYAVELVKSR